MTNVESVSLENEMDLVLAHKKSMRVAERLGLTVATQTTFATAVAEIARAVIEHTDKGQLHIGLEQNKQRYMLVAAITFDKSIQFNNSDTGYYYAQKLVPEFQMISTDTANTIEMKIGVPRSLKLDPARVALLARNFREEEPINAYEELKVRNTTLSKIALEKEAELLQSRLIDEKKTEFISVASHEIKTPITIIKAYTQIAKTMGDQCSPEVKELLGKVDVQTNKLLSLIHQLLDISKIENGNLAYSKEDVSLNLFVQDMVTLIGNIVPEHKIEVSLGDDVTIHIDRLRMEQVFSNLIVNAAKYSRGAKFINICTGTERPGYATVSVQDFGIGMSARSMESIFNKFYRDQDVLTTHSGLGMGLYIASKIISDHGGEIWAESTEGGGSTFYFTIPEADSL